MATSEESILDYRTSRYFSPTDSSLWCFLPDAQAYARPERRKFAFLGLGKKTHLLLHLKKVPSDITRIRFLVWMKESMILFENGERLGPFFPGLSMISGLKHYVAGFFRLHPGFTIILGAVTWNKQDFFGKLQDVVGGYFSRCGRVGLGISEMASGRSKSLGFFPNLKFSRLGK